MDLTRLLNHGNIYNFTYEQAVICQVGLFSEVPFIKCSSRPSSRPKRLTG
jgi:hypothetical protein